MCWSYNRDDGGISLRFLRADQGRLQGHVQVCISGT